MAKVTNAFDTYSATANREELADVIYNIAPTDTPVMTAAGRKNVSNVTFDWQTDTLAAASATGVLEGDALSQSSPRPPLAKAMCVKSTAATRL